MSPCLRIVNAHNRNRVKDWKIIADNLSKAGWSWGCVSAIDSNGRTIWIADEHRDDGGTAGAFALTKFAFLIQAATSSASFCSTTRIASYGAAILPPTCRDPDRVGDVSKAT